jgi:ATP-dependent exoDNAse (exonuclease V) alpha subunit
VQLLNLFPLELAFAMTIHKAQGRNMPKVILALESRPSYNLQMEFPAIFVAMSRVKKGDDMRVLHGFDSRSSFEDAFSYLTKLKPNKSVSLFYSGYINDNGPWQRQLAFQNAAPRTPL